MNEYSFILIVIATIMMVAVLYPMVLTILGLIVVVVLLGAATVILFCEAFEGFKEITRKRNDES